MAIKAVADFDRVDLQSARSYSTFVEGKLPIKAIELRTTLETGTEAILHNEVTKNDFIFCSWRSSL